MLEKTLESPLDCKEIQPVHPKGDQRIFIGGTDVEAETPTRWPPDVKNWLIGKDPDAGKDWGREEKGTTEDEMVGWHRWLDGHGFGWTPGVGDAAVHGIAKSQTWLSNWTELKPFNSGMVYCINIASWFRWPQASYLIYLCLSCPFVKWGNWQYLLHGIFLRIRWVNIWKTLRKMPGSQQVLYTYLSSKIHILVFISITSISSMWLKAPWG